MDKRGELLGKTKMKSLVSREGKIYLNVSQGHINET